MQKNDFVNFYSPHFSNNIVCGTTTKNFGDMSSKSKTGVMKLAKYLNFDKKNLFQLRQVHSNKISLINNTSKNFGAEGDGLYTFDKNVILLIKTADCVPVLLTESFSNLIMLLHAGREGIKNGIIQSALSILKKLNIKNTKIILGPSICANCYEIDLKRKISNELVEGGVLLSNILDQGLCTLENNSVFYSYRRGDKTERNATFIYRI